MLDSVVPDKGVMMEFDTLFGLPAHPLLVHAPIVMLPLAAIGAVMLILPSWRRRIGWIVVGLAGLSVVFTQLAISSGWALEESVEDSGSHELISRHADVADQLRPIALLFFLAVLSVMLFEWWAARKESTTANEVAASPVTRGLAIAAVVLAIASSVWVVKVGHKIGRAHV